MTTFIPPAAWIGGTRGSIVVNEPLFAPRGIRLTTGQPPEPPIAEDFFFEHEGAGYVPMFRAAGDAIARGWLDTPHPPDRGHARRASHHRRPSRCLADATHRTVGLGELEIKKCVPNGQVPSGHVAGL
jgi:hypothetical protein